MESLPENRVEIIKTIPFPDRLVNLLNLRSWWEALLKIPI